MKHSNFRPFFVLLISVLILYALSLFVEDMNWGEYKIKQFDLLSDLKPPKNYIETIKIDTILSELQTISDSTFTVDSNIVNSAYSPSTENLSNDSIGNLELFFNSLKASQEKGSKTRIAYFGDSMIEGDLVTQDLRNFLQQKFGGSGVGFVPITSVVAGFRQTITHTFSDNWSDFTLIKSDTQQLHKPGITGHTFIPVNYYADSTKKIFSWVKYSASKKFKKLSSFNNIKLYYGKSNQQNKLFTEFKGTYSKYDLIGNNLVNELILNQNTIVNDIKINFNIRHNIPIYGVSFESDSGIILDNFSFRGNSGLGLTNVPQKLLSEINHYLDYKLIILHYGLNVASPEMKNFSWYEAGMNKVIRHIRNCFPNASILLISVSDKSFKENMEFVTIPSIPYLVKTQEKIARKNKIAYWNLYEAMGGYNSMVRWVEGDTVLANKDYTHLNFRGARKVAELLYKHLMKEYKNSCTNPPLSTSNLVSYKK